MSISSRRKFLAITSGALAATGLTRKAFANSEVGYKLGIQMYSLRGFDLDVALQHAADLGFAQVEFYKGMLSTSASDEEITSVRKKVVDLGMSISAHGVNKFTKKADANRKIFKFAKKLGIASLTADPDPESFDSLNELVKEFDIRIAIHNHGPRHRVS